MVFVAVPPKPICTRQKRKNLHILTNILTEKVLSLKTAGRSAFRAKRGGETITIKARQRSHAFSRCNRLAANPDAFGHWPDAEELATSTALTSFGKSICRCGKNLQDHLQARPIFKCTVPTINTRTVGLFNQAKIALEYILKQTGPMTMAASLGTGYLKTRPELETPDIQFHIQPFSSENPDHRNRRSV